MTDNNSEYDLWLIDFFVQRTKETLDGQEKGMETLKARATSLLGWVITLSLASITALSASVIKKNIFVATSLGIISVLLILCAISCVVVLFSKKWKYLEYGEHDIKDFNRGSQIETLKAQLRSQDVAFQENILYYQNARRFMKLAWVLLCSTPIVLIITVLISLFV